MGPICFVVSNQEFLFRHFQPALSAAKMTGRDVIAFAPGQNEGQETWIDGVKVVSSPTRRKHNSLQAIIGEAIWFARAFHRVRPAIVVCYSLRMCFVVALLQFLFSSIRFVFVVTGVGFLGISAALKAKAARWIIFRTLKYTSLKHTHFIFENRSDPVSTGISLRDHRLSILMGAGIDPREFVSAELPEAPPFRFATVSRLVWSKGIDLAAQAISSLAQQGYPVELHIYGAPDPSNPRPVDPETLQGIPGVRYHGFSDQVATIWSSCHAAIFTSRGGEGLPRALLEASACGRPSVVTAVPGCQDFIRDGVEGYIVPLGSEHALREAIIKLIATPEQLSMMGQRARRRTLDTSTNEIIQTEYERIFGSFLQQRLASTAPVRSRHARAAHQSRLGYRDVMINDTER
ncbi:MAG: glycosyltransferase [Pseudomonadota bacterium]